MGKTRKAGDRLAKRLGEVKVPKSLRQVKLGDLFRSPVGQKVLLGAIVATAGALAASKAAKSPKVRAYAAELKHKGGKRARKAVEASGLLTHALGEAARSFNHALRGDGAEAPRPLTAETWRSTEELDRPAAKKRPKRPADLSSPL